MTGFGLGTGFDAARGGGLPGWALVGAALDLDFQRGRFMSARKQRSFADLFSFSRNSVGMAQKLDGSWETFAANEPRITDKGILIEEARTNVVKNSTMVGGVDGAPGTKPTHWPDIASVGLIITRSFGVEGGLPYFQVRLNGTASSNNVRIEFDETGAAASDGQTWTGSFIARLVAGALPAEVRQLRILGLVTAFDEVGTTISITSSDQLFQRSRTLAGGFTVVRHVLRLGLSVGQTYDFTLRFKAIQLEQGAFATSPIPTSGSAVTRPNDVCSISGLSGLDAAHTLYAAAVPQSPVSDTTNRSSVQLEKDGNNRTVLFRGATNGYANVALITGAVTQAGFNNTTPYGPDAFMPIAAGVQENNVRASFDGALSITDPNATLPTGVTILRIGTTAGPYFNGYVARVSLWASRLLDATVEALTEPPVLGFVDQTGLATSTLIESNTITVSGLFPGVEVPARVSGGEMRVNGGAWGSSPVIVKNGDTIQLRRTSSGSPATAVNVVATVGNTSDTWSVTTA